MMFRCYECGNLFEDGEQAVWHENYGAEIGGEMFEGCPVCKGAYEQVYQCDGCGEWHSGDELYHGWCEECLRATIDYDTFFEYCEANKEDNYLDTFVMCYLLNCDGVPKYPSWEFHQLMISTYNNHVRIAKESKLIGNKCICDFLEDCIRFVMDDDGDCGKENYADWLNNNREVK